MKTIQFHTTQSAVEEARQRRLPPKQVFRLEDLMSENETLGDLLSRISENGPEYAQELRARVNQLASYMRRIRYQVDLKQYKSYEAYILDGDLFGLQRDLGHVINALGSSGKEFDFLSNFETIDLNLKLSERDDCYATPIEDYNSGYDTYAELRGTRNAKGITDDPYLNRGRDPTFNAGLRTQRDWKRIATRDDNIPAHVDDDYTMFLISLNLPQLSHQHNFPTLTSGMHPFIRYRWACCGQTQQHPGCWMREVPSTSDLIADTPQPYEAVPAWDAAAIWKRLTEENLTEEQIVRTYWEPLVRGDAWLDKSYYDKLHAKIVALKEALGPRIATLMIESSQEKQYNVDAPFKLRIVDETRDQLKQLFRAVDTYNMPHCAETTFILNEFFDLQFVLTYYVAENLNFILVGDERIELLKYIQKTPYDEIRGELNRVAVEEKTLQEIPNMPDVLTIVRNLRNRVNVFLNKTFNPTRPLSNFVDQVRQSNLNDPYLSESARRIEQFLTRIDNDPKLPLLDFKRVANAEIKKRDDARVGPLTAPFNEFNRSIAIDQDEIDSRLQQVRQDSVRLNALQATKSQSVAGLLREIELRKGQIEQPYANMLEDIERVAESLQTATRLSPELLAAQRLLQENLRQFRDDPLVVKQLHPFSDRMQRLLQASQNRQQRVQSTLQELNKVTAVVMAAVDSNLKFDQNFNMRLRRDVDNVQPLLSAEQLLPDAVFTEQQILQALARAEEERDENEQAMRRRRVQEMSQYFNVLAPAIAEEVLIGDNFNELEVQYGRLADLFLELSDENLKAQFDPYLKAAKVISPLGTKMSMAQAMPYRIEKPYNFLVLVDRKGRPFKDREQVFSQWASILDLYVSQDFDGTFPKDYKLPASFPKQPISIQGEWQEIPVNRSAVVEPVTLEMVHEKSPNNLLTEANLLYTANSCWIDSTMSALFKIAGTDLEAQMRNKQAIRLFVQTIDYGDGDVYQSDCDKDKANSIHQKLMQDIHDIQYPLPENRRETCLLRTELSSCVAETFTTGEQNSAPQLLKQLTEIYNLHQQIRQINTAGEFENTNEAVDVLWRNFSDFIVRGGKVDITTIGGNVTWEISSVIVIQFAAEKAGGLLRGSHYVSYNKDPLTNRWWLFDDTAPDPKRFAVGEIPKTLRGQEAREQPAIVVYRRKDELQRIVADFKSFDTTANRPVSKLFDPQVADTDALWKIYLDYDSTLQDLQFALDALPKLPNSNIIGKSKTLIIPDTWFSEAAKDSVDQRRLQAYIYALVRYRQQASVDDLRRAMAFAQVSFAETALPIKRDFPQVFETDQFSDFVKTAKTQPYGKVVEQFNTLSRRGVVAEFVNFRDAVAKVKDDNFRYAALIFASVNALSGDRDKVRKGLAAAQIN